MIAHESMPAAIHGYRFKYAKTRQTVFIFLAEHYHTQHLPALEVASELKVLC